MGFKLTPPPVLGLIFESLINTDMSLDTFVLLNNVLEKYNNIKETNKNPESISSDNI